jgi:GAG-pre-integrase domain
LHICNKHDSFIEYCSSNAKVQGVRNTLSKTHGHGTVKVQAHMNDITCILILQNILYVPSNQYNLLSLRRWDSHGRHFKSSQGTLSLMNQDGRVITCGLKLKSHLYKMKIRTIGVTERTGDDRTEAPGKAKIPTAFAVNKVHTWEEWHRCFGHIGYKGLRELQCRNLVKGFSIDQTSSKSDC